MKKENSKYIITLALIIVAQMIYTIYIFAFVKQGNHSDEVWLYGLANSYYDPFISFEKGADIQTYKNLRNVNEWIQGDTLKNYITVQPGERFAYGSVYYNNTFDVHPPLFHMILHTVSSFFPNTFSWWYGFGINLGCLILTQIFLYLFVKKISKNESTALLVCMFYAGGIGAVCTFTFIRQYTLLIALCMLYSYFCACYCEKVFETGQVSRKLLVAMGITSFCAFLTHYFGIAFIGAFTAFVCVYLVCRKKIWEMLLYGSSVFIALELSFLVYPSALFDIIHDDGKPVKYFSPSVQIRILMSDLFEYNFGFKIGYFPTAFWNITIPAVIMAVVVAVILLFPFRKETWFGKFIKWIWDKCRNFIRFLRYANYFPAISLLAAVVIYEWTAHCVDVFAMGIFSMRYTCVVLPYICVATVMGAKKVLGLAVRNQRNQDYIMFALIVCVLIRVHVSAIYPYTFMEIGDGKNLQELFADKNVMVVEEKTGYFITKMTSLIPVLDETEAVCFMHTRTTDEESRQELVGQKAIDYFLIYENIFPLADEESQTVIRWVNEEKRKYSVENQKIEEGAMTLIDERESTEDPFEKKEKLLEELGIDDGYELVGAIERQMGVYYVVKPRK